MLARILEALVPLLPQTLECMAQLCGRVSEETQQGIWNSLVSRQWEDQEIPELLSLAGKCLSQSAEQQSWVLGLVMRGLAADVPVEPELVGRLGRETLLSTPGQLVQMSRESRGALAVLAAVTGSLGGQYPCSQEAAPVLLTLLSSDDSGTRLLAVTSLSHLEGLARVPLSAALLSCISAESHPEVMNSMLRLLMRTGQVRVEGLETYNQESQDRMQEYQSSLKDQSLEQEERKGLTQQICQEETLQQTLREYHQQ